MPDGGAKHASSVRAQSRGKQPTCNWPDATPWGSSWHQQLRDIWWRVTSEPLLPRTADSFEVPNGLRRTPAYDAIAGWYETEFLGVHGTDDVPRGDPIGVGAAVTHLLGKGTGPCLEIGCGTGIHSARVRHLGHRPIGVDISSKMLQFAKGRLPVAVADAAHLPFDDDTFTRVMAVMIHTDVPDYSAVLREAARVLVPGGTFVHVGVHPCFCGGFADRTNPEKIVIEKGYTERHWTDQSWTDRGLRDKVGATHIPLPELIGSVIASGLVVAELREGGEPTPMTLALRALKQP